MNPVLERASLLLEKENAPALLRALKKLNVSHLSALERGIYFEYRAMAFKMKGEFHKALPEFKNSIKNYLRSGDRLAAGTSSLSVGDMLRQLEKFSDSRTYYVQAQKLIPKNSDRSIDPLIGLALSFRGEGKFELSFKSFEKCLSLVRKNEDQEGEAYVLWAMGTTERFLGNLKSAKKYLESSITIYTRLGDEGGLAYALAGLGGTLRVMGRAKLSGANYRRAAIIFSKLKDDFGLAYSSCGQGNAFRMQNQFSKARPFIKKALSLYKRLNLIGPRAYVLWSWGNLNLAEGRRAVARKIFGEVQKSFQAVHDPRGQVYADLGWMVFYKGFDSKKFKFYRNRIEKKSKMWKMKLEEGHAVRLIDEKKAQKIYEKCGVDWKSFRNYRQFP